MRQSGRVLPEYRSVRKSLTLSQLYEDPDLSARLGALPVERFELDAAVVVTDVRLPLVGLGLLPSLPDPDDGPAPPLASAGVPRLRRPTEVDFGALPDTVRQTVRRVGDRADVMAVVGAPFSLAASALDAAAPAEAVRTRALLYGEPDSWHSLADVLAEVAVRAADLQISSGARVVHVYDTWVGALSEAEYRALVLPWSRRVLEAIAAMGAPAIHYSSGAPHLLEAMRDAGGEVLGIDWRLGIAEAWDRIGQDRGLQGNLDPIALVGPTDGLLAAAREVLEAVGGRPGFVFGLGHGLLPATPASQIHALVRYVHAHHE